MASTADDKPVLEPVSDWVNDWDWLDDQWGEHAIDIFNTVREQCPIATTERYGRSFMPVTMEAAKAIAHDTEHFSSWRVNISMPGATAFPAPPITSDPPDHLDHRKVLLQSFSPKNIAGLEDELRRYARHLIASLDGLDAVDAADVYTQKIPVHGICVLTGAPESDADIYLDWIYRNFQIAPRRPEVRSEVSAEMSIHFDALLRDRLENPRDDMLTMIANAEIDGEAIPWGLKTGYVGLLIIAGIDTTWSALGSGLWHFAQHPEDAAQLVDSPNDSLLWQTATEEVLRYYAPVSMARQVVKDVEVAGCPMRVGEQTLVNFPAANHDPDAFEHPEEFRIDRLRNRHVAFGIGIHRCVGSNLARLELLVGLQEWIKAFPNYSLDPTKRTRWANGQVRGPRNLPVLLNR